MTTPLATLQAYEAKLVKAAADPMKQVWYDDFRKENRPFSEISAQLAWVRSEIAAHPDSAGTTTPRPRLLKIQCSSSGY